MRLIEQVTIDFANEIIRDAIGKSAIELQIENLEKDSELRKRNSELRERDSELRERDSELKGLSSEIEFQSRMIKQSIINLRVSMNLTDDQIASIIGADINYIRQILENDNIKKAD